MLPKLKVCLWFKENNAEYALHFYHEIFEGSEITHKNLYDNHFKELAGLLLSAELLLKDFSLFFLNGYNDFLFNESISLVINCENQQEIDYYWDKLSKNGLLQQCGWLKDQFGVSWQIIPKNLDQLLNCPDPEKRKRIQNEMFQMVKIDYNKLKDLYEKD